MSPPPRRSPCRFRPASVAALFFLTAGGLAACGGGGGDPPVGPRPGPPAAMVAAVVITTARPVGLTVGGSVTLVAEARTAAGVAVAGAAISWQALDGAVATVSGGVVQAVAPGSARVVASAAGAAGPVADTVTVTVAAPPPVVARVVVTTARPVTVLTGATVALAAEARTADGAPVAGTAITWASLDAGVVTVSAAGVVTAGAAPGTARIVASAAGPAGPLADTVAVAVTARPAASVTVVDTLLFAGIAPGEAARLLATARDAAGGVVDRPVAWSSGAPGVATVAADGTVQGVAPGTAVVTATADGATASRTVRVTARPLRFDLVYDGVGGTVDEATRAAVAAAARRWQRVVVEASAGATGGACTLPGDQTARAASGRYQVRVRVGALPAGTFGQQSYDCLRVDDQPFASTVTLAPALVAAAPANPGAVAAIVAHEIGHGLGIGSWRYRGVFLTDGGFAAAATLFTGVQAVSAWQGVGGNGQVPVQPTEPGSGNHWSRPGGLCLELMAPSVGAGSSLSVVTLAALADLGWRVALERADPFTRQTCSP